MDLQNLDLEKAAGLGATLHLVHPITGELLYNDDKTPATLDLVGADSKQFHRHAAQMYKTKGGASDSAADLRKKNVKTLVKCITGSNIQYEGVILSTPQEIQRLLTERYWVAEQANEFVLERDNFFGQSSTD